MAIPDSMRLDNGIVAYCMCCSGALAMLISSFVLAIFAKNEVEVFKDTVSSFASTWETDMVFDLSLSPNTSRPSNQYYVSEWKSQWPGNNEGCWCEKSDLIQRVQKGLKEQRCNSTQTKGGCVNIDERGPQDLNKWINSQTIYAVRGTKTSFKQNYLNMDSDGTCKAGFKNCGDKNSKSRGFCIPNSFLDCPITDISSTPVDKYTPLNMLGIKLWMGRPADKNPVSDLMYVQDFACFVRSHYGRTPGRSKYVLLKGDHDS